MRDLRQELSRPMVHEYLALMAETIEFLEFIHVTEEGLRADAIRCAAVERWILKLVDLAFAINVHICWTHGIVPETYRRSFQVAAEIGFVSRDHIVDLESSAELRNDLVFRYRDVDTARLAAGVPLAIARYPEYVRRVATYAAGMARDGM